MKILSIDSSSISASVAITEDKNLIGEYTTASNLKHSETLLPMIKSMLMSTNLAIDDIDLFAINAGPGSFTGVRIGISVIKGLTFGKNKPIASISSLASLAYNVRESNKLVVPVMDARRDQFYNAIFYQGQRITPDDILVADQLTDLIFEKSKQLSVDEVEFVGDGTNLALQKIAVPNKSSASGKNVVSSAYSTACIACDNYINQVDIYSDIEISPIYLRLSQAERERNERLSKEN